MARDGREGAQRRAGAAPRQSRLERPQMHWQIDVQLLALVVLANGMPVLGRMLLPNWLSSPVDSHLVWPDGAQIFGSSKTRRGFVWPRVLLALRPSLSACHGQSVSLSASPRCVETYFRGFSNEGLGCCLAAVQPFWIKVPESLFPALLCRWMFDLTWADVAFVNCHSRR
jgi:hypothetical protein